MNTIEAKKRLKVSVVFGTRPEAVKLCPVVWALKNDQAFQCRVCVTGQHREMLDQVLGVFNIVPDEDLALMKANQSLGEFTARAISALDEYVARDRPDIIVVQGDTTTVLCASLAAFYHHVPVAHVEAGLRTWNLESPWPEEANRQLTSRLAYWHFAPTESNRKNLLQDGIPAKKVFVTGNTGIDALFHAKNVVDGMWPDIPDLPPEVLAIPADAKTVLVTGHRRENFGAGLENICHAIRTLAARHREVHFIYPVHLNPNVRKPVERILGEALFENIHLTTPQGYLQFVALMHKSTIILTDSGGVQEEAPSLGKPVLVMRETTERPEAVEAGVAKLVGTDSGGIVAAVERLLSDCQLYNAMAKAVNPYGDGKAAARIVSILKGFAP